MYEAAAPRAGPPTLLPEAAALRQKPARHLIEFSVTMRKNDERRVTPFTTDERSVTNQISTLNSAVFHGDARWKRIWDARLTEQSQTILYRAAVGKLKLYGQTGHKGGICPLCGTATETMEHFLDECEYADNMHTWWARILIKAFPYMRNRDTLTPFRTTITYGVTQTFMVGEEENLMWRICVAAQLRVLWHERNRRSHGEEHLGMGSLCGQWTAIVRTELNRALCAKTMQGSEKAIRGFSLELSRACTTLTEGQLMIPQLECTTLPWSGLDECDEEVEFRLLVYD
jgi:hypothetical protein